MNVTIRTLLHFWSARIAGLFRAPRSLKRATLRNALERSLPMRMGDK